MLLSKLFFDAGIACPEEYSNIEISGVVTDSRKAFAGCIFVCVAGHNNDGHDYIYDAIKKGDITAAYKDYDSYKKQMKIAEFMKFYQEGYNIYQNNNH